MVAAARPRHVFATSASMQS